MPEVFHPEGNREFTEQFLILLASTVAIAMIVTGSQVGTAEDCHLHAIWLIAERSVGLRFISAEPLASSPAGHQPQVNPGLGLPFGDLHLAHFAQRIGEASRTFE